MKAMILDPQVKVYSSMEENAMSIATLHAGSEIEFGGPKRKAGRLWVPITLSTGQQAYIPGEARIKVIQTGAILQNNIQMRNDPSAEAMVKQVLPRGTKLFILNVIRAGSGEWVKVRDMNGVEGYIEGNTRIHIIQQKTKALGKRNVIRGAMYLLAGLIVSINPPSESTTYVWIGYGAILFGAVILIAGIVQYIKAPS